MKRVPFEPPTEHYDKRIEAIDEQICHLIKQRKELSKVYGMDKVPSLDGILIPRRDLIHRSALIKGAVISSRGCPYHCAYCNWSYSCNQSENNI